MATKLPKVICKSYRLIIIYNDILQAGITPFGESIPPFRALRPEPASSLIKPQSLAPRAEIAAIFHLAHRHLACGSSRLPLSSMAAAASPEPVPLRRFPAGLTSNTSHCVSSRQKAANLLQILKIQAWSSHSILQPESSTGPNNLNKTSNLKQPLFIYFPPFRTSERLSFYHHGRESLTPVTISPYFPKTRQSSDQERHKPHDLHLARLTLGHLAILKNVLRLSFLS